MVYFGNYFHKNIIEEKGTNKENLLYLNVITLNNNHPTVKFAEGFV